MTEAESVAAFNEAYESYKAKIGHTKFRPTHATSCLPGSPQKVAILALRYEYGAEKGLFNPHDARRSDPVPTLDLLDLVSADDEP
ncbi:hypothetical protein [Planctomyces sp. SH-PL14]|uniref:hypothetical protein n=1 Tax=Planctomyces sp. SH-PL14 TaxID=1632864 RepID=UPI0012E8DECE|nr:hypothetical protein [Planctomyces sp. SH-PL14]